MTKPLSLDLGRRAIAAIDAGLSRRAAATPLGAAPSAAATRRRLARSTGPGRRRSGRIEAPGPAILAMAEETPDVARVEIA